MNLFMAASQTVARVAGDIQFRALHPSQGAVVADGVVTLGLVEGGAYGTV